MYIDLVQELDNLDMEGGSVAVAESAKAWLQRVWMAQNHNLGS
jgi:hypothetical protein